MRNRRCPRRHFRPLRYTVWQLRKTHGRTALAITRIRAGHRDERFMLGAARRLWVITRHTMQPSLFGLHFTVCQPSKSRRWAWAVAPILVIGLPGLLQASGARPLTLVSGAGDRDSIRVTFRNIGKLPIRRTEFSCVLARGQAHPVSNGDCREDNAMFFSATPCTVRYAYPGGVPRTVLVSVKSVTLSGGYVWKPLRHETCRVLRIVPAHRRTDP